SWPLLARPTPCWPPQPRPGSAPACRSLMPRNGGMLLPYGYSDDPAAWASDLRQYGGMADPHRTAGRWSVEPVTPAIDPAGHDGQWLRVRYLGYYIADCGSVAELERWVRLGELERNALTLAA